MRYLVENGADMNKADIYGCTPLMVAQMEGHAEMVAYLHGGRGQIRSQQSPALFPLSLGAPVVPCTFVEK